MSDDNGGTWQSAAFQSKGSVADIQIWYSLNHPGGSTTVTAAYGSSVSGIAANLSEWSGIVSAAAFDVSAGTTGSSNTPGTGVVTTINASDLLIGAAAQQGKSTISSGPINSFLPLTDAVTNASAGNVNTMSAYQVEGASGPYSTDWTTSASAGWAGAIAAFKAASP